MSKERIRRVLVSKEEKRLVLKSDIIEHYPKVKQILEKDDTSIYTNSLYDLKETDKDTYDTFVYAFDEIKKDAEKEWYQAGYLGRQKSKCELCGNSRLTKIYKIVNSKNNNSYIVGSECIYKFKTMNKNFYGMDIKKFSKIVDTNLEKTNRIKIFCNKYPEGTGIIEKWKDEYNSFDLVIPRDMEYDFIKIFKNASEFYKHFVNGKIDIKDLYKFDNYIIDYEYKLKKYNEFRINNIDDIYSCNKIIKSWLEDTNQKTILDFIANYNGKITKDIAQYIYCIEFINRFKDKIMVDFLRFNLKLEDLNSNEIAFSFKYKDFSSIIYQLSLKEFSKRYSFVYFDKRHLVREDIIINMKIKNTYYSVNEYIDICIRILKNSNLYLEFNEDLYKRQEIEITNRSQKIYAILNVTEFINATTIILYEDEIVSKEILTKFINKIKNWNDISNKKKFEIDEKDISSIYKNR